MPDQGRNAVNCRDAVRDLIRSLDLIADDQVQSRRRPWSANQIYSGITCWRGKNRTAASSVSTERIGYGINVTGVRRNSDSTADSDILAPWSEISRRASIWERLTPTLETNSTFCTVTFEEADDVNVPKDFEAYEVETFIVRCWVDEVRQ